ncbi:MAG: UDP-glucose/GDP-mannose dehydrogenase family protein [Bacilli bacterium]
MKISVAGTGYVGLVSGVCLSEMGHDVTCVDLDENKIGLMVSGKSPIYENGLEELMVKNYKIGRLKFTTNYKDAYKNSEAILIGVGTPERKDGSANLSYVYKVVEQIAQSLENNCVVIVKSTVPIGTNDDIEEYFKKHIKNDICIDVVSNPEFLSQGTAVHDTLNASRIVIGTESKTAEKIMLEIYEPFNLPIVSISRRSAEMVKYASNDFLALKISYMNDIANLCEIVGADVIDVAKGMSFDKRIGNKFLSAGCGYGGSCFPKDTKALHYLAGQNEYQLKTIKAAIEINETQKVILITKARKYFTSFEGLTIAILGLTFKPGTDDLREAPSLANIEILLDEGAIIKAFDPVGIDNYKKIYPTEIQYVCNPIQALIGADACFIFTEWDEIKKLSCTDYIENMKNPTVFDGRNIYDKKIMENSNIVYVSIGR